MTGLYWLDMACPAGAQIGDAATSLLRDTSEDSRCSTFSNFVGVGVSKTLVGCSCSEVITSGFIGTCSCLLSLSGGLYIGGGFSWAILCPKVGLNIGVRHPSAGEDLSMEEPLMREFFLDMALDPGREPGGVGVGRILTAPGMFSGRMDPF